MQAVCSSNSLVKFIESNGWSGKRLIARDRMDCNSYLYGEFQNVTP